MATIIESTPLYTLVSSGCHTEFGQELVNYSLFEQGQANLVMAASKFEQEPTTNEVAYG